MNKQTAPRKPDGYCAWHPTQGWFVNGVSKLKGAAVNAIAQTYGVMINVKGNVKKWQQTHEGKSWQIKPVCLVPPELLDWVEIIRSEAKVCLSYCESEDDNIKSPASYFRNMLADLNKILPEPYDQTKS